MALALREALVDFLAVVEVVDQHEHLVGVAAQVEADRRAGPVDRPLPLHLVEHLALAVAQADADRARSLAARDIGVGLALVLQNVFEQLGEAGSAFAEGAFCRGEQIVPLERVGGRLARRCRRGIGGCGAGGCRLHRRRGRGIRRRVGFGLLRGRRRALLLGRRRPQVRIDRRIGIDRRHLSGCRHAAQPGQGDCQKREPTRSHHQHFPNFAHFRPLSLGKRCCHGNEWALDRLDFTSMWLSPLIAGEGLVIGLDLGASGDVGEWLKPAVC